MNDTVPLAARLEATRQAVLLANRIGVHGTRAIVDAGLGELSSNVAIAVVTELADRGPLRPRDLLGATQLTRGGLSNLLDRLEAAGFVARTYGAVPGDRRGAVVVLTEQGNAAATRIGDVVARALEELDDVVRDFTAAVETIMARPGHQTSGTGSGAVAGAGALSVAGAVLSKALADAAPDDPTPIATTLALCSAARSGHTRPKDLIEVTGRPSASVTRLLDRLEVEGLVVRRVGRPPDRRAVIVTLTDEGRDQLERRLDAVADRLARSGPAAPDRAG